MNKKNFILNNAETKYFDYFFLKRLRYGKSIVVHIDKEGTDFSVTIPKDANFDAIKLKGDTVQDGTPTPDAPANIEVVTGEQTIKINNTTYTVDLGSIELCTKANYLDYIYKDGDDWYVHKDMGKVTFNGTENWSFSGNNLTLGRTSVGAKGGTEDLYSNVATPNYHYGTNNNECYIGNSNIIFCKMIINDVAVSSANDWKTYLTNNPSPFYFPLATATDTKITDETLIEQLDALLAGGLKAGSNTIKVTAPSGILPTIFNIIINH